MIKLLNIIIAYLIFYSINIYCMIDNRFLPLFRQQYMTRRCDRRSVAGSNIFFIFGDKGFGEDGKDVPVPEIVGNYDLIKVARAIQMSGQPNPLNSQLSSFPKLEVPLKGKIEAQGLWVGFEKNIFDFLTIGFNTYIMHVSSRERFVISKRLKTDLKFSRGSETIFDMQLRKTNDLLCINSFQFNKTDITDLDLYLSLGFVRDYFFKLRRFDFATSFGVLFPSGPIIDVNNPASIPFGGNGHFGIYGRLDLTTELKEDMTVGFWFEILKRLKKNENLRIPINDEQERFAPIIGSANVNPGLTIGFSPFVAFEDIRDGFGFKVRYTLISHFADKFDNFCIKKDLKPSCDDLVEHSKWDNEFFTFTLLYDFTKGATKCRKFAPIVYLEWDRPTKVLIASRAAKTNRVSFGFEFSF